MTHLLTILGMGVVTYLTRLLPIHFLTRKELPLWSLQAMRYIPTAVLTAIIFTEVLWREDRFDISFGNERLLAALLAGVVAWRTRNTLLTIASGMIALWLLQAGSWLIG